MEHHIITTDARELLTHWTESSTILEPDQAQLGHGGTEELNCTKKSRRSITEAERGLKAEPNALRPPTTKAGKHRIRMKWSPEVNEFIMRTYYTITHNETQTKAYRDSLHKLFAQQYPDVAISQQRIADQRRAIVKNNLLTKAQLDAIREEVAQSLGTLNPVIKQEPINVTVSQVPVPPHPHLQQHHHHHPQQVQVQQQQQHPHLQHQSHLSTPIRIQTTTTSSPGLQHTRIHQASPNTAAALQNQPHIIIRVNPTNPNGVHHFVDDGTSI